MKGRNQPFTPGPGTLSPSALESLFIGLQNIREGGNSIGLEAQEDLVGEEEG